MKIVINSDFGGFGLSDAALEELGMSYPDAMDLKRNDPRLVAVVEKLGDDVNTRFSRLVVVEIPDDVDDWYIMNYDGMESIHEGRSWS